MQILITRHDSSYEQKDFTRQLLKTPIVDQRIEDDWTQFMMGDCEVVLPYTEDNWAFFYPGEEPPTKLSMDFRVSGATVFKGVNYLGPSRDLKLNEITLQFLDVMKELEAVDFTSPNWGGNHGSLVNLQDALMTAAEANSFQLDFQTNYILGIIYGQLYKFEDIYIAKSYLQQDGFTMLQFIKDVALSFNMIFWLDYGDPVDTPSGTVVSLDMIKMRDRGTKLGSMRTIQSELLDGKSEGKEHPKGVVVRLASTKTSLGDSENALEINLPSTLGPNVIIQEPGEPLSFLPVPGEVVDATAEYYYRWMLGNKGQYFRAKVLATDILPMNWLHIPALNSQFSFLVNAVKQDFVDGISEIEGEALAA